MLEQQLLARLEQLGILKASTVSNIRVLEPAEVAAWAGPDRRMPIVFGAVIGLALAVALVLGRNFFRQGIEDAREIEALGSRCLQQSVNPSFWLVKRPVLLNMVSRCFSPMIWLLKPCEVAKLV